MASSSPTEGNKYVQGLFTTATPALVSGAIQAILFNPFDRALYVRVHNQRDHFLDRRNFAQPFQGFGNAALYRTICSASYIFWQDSCRFFIEEWTPSLSKQNAPIANSLLVGLVAGGINGAALNNMQAVKFRMWSVPNAKQPTTFLGTAREMYRVGGWRVFFGGIRVTIARDSVFGMFYELLRTCHTMQMCFQSISAATISMQASMSAALFSSLKSNDGITNDVMTRSKPTAGSDRNRAQFLLNMTAAIAACIASSPLNYARTVIYGSLGATTPSGEAKAAASYVKIIKGLFAETKAIVDTGMSAAQIAAGEHNKATHGNGGKKYWRSGWRHLNSRLNVGWGSLRVGLGMAVGQQVFALVKDAMEA